MKKEINQVNEKGQVHGYWEYKLWKTLYWKGYYINGKPIGLWKHYNDNENILDIRYYSN